MSDTTTYNVQVLYRLNSGDATQKVASLSDSFKTLSSMSSWAAGKMDGLASSIISMGKWALLGAGALGVRALAEGITTLNSEAETATIGIAGMLQAGGAFNDFQAAMGRSTELMDEMRKDAAALPGTFDDLRRVFEGGLLGSLAAGKTSKQAEKMAASFMAVSKMLNVDSHTAGRELSMLLGGRAGAHVVLWSRLQPIIGKTAQEFNAMSNKDRFEAIEKALKGFDPAVRAFAHTWDAISSTTKDIWTHFKRMAATPMFNALKSDLDSFNIWTENNKALLIEWEMIVGGNIVAAYQKVKDILQWIWTHHSQLIESAKHAATGGLIARAGLGLLGNAGGAGLARAGLSAIGGLVGGGVGSGALLAAAVIAPLAIAAATGKVNLENTFRKVMTAVDPLVTSFGHLAEALLPTITDLGRFSAGLIEAVADGLTPFTSALGRFIDLQADSIRYWSENLQNWASSFMQWSRDHGLVNDRRQNVSNDIPLSDFYSLNPSEGGLNLIRHLWHMVTTGDPVIMNGAIHNASLDTAATGGTEDLGRMSHFQFNSSQLHAMAEEVRRQTHAQGATNVNVRIEATISDASDPTRVYADIRRAVFDGVFRPMELPKTTVLR